MKKLFEYVNPNEKPRLFQSVDENDKKQNFSEQDNTNDLKVRPAKRRLFESIEEGGENGIKKENSQEISVEETSVGEGGKGFQEVVRADGGSYEKPGLENTGWPSIQQFAEVYAGLRRDFNPIAPNNSYMAMANQRDTAYVSNSKHCKYAEKFIYEDGELLGDNDGKIVVIGNFQVTILAEIERLREICDETNEVIRIEKELFWEVEIIILERKYNGIVRQKEYDKLSWIREISKNRAYIEEDALAKRFLKKYLNRLILDEKFGKIYEYTSTGWKNIEEVNYYLTSSGVVGHPEIPMRAVDGCSFFGRGAERLEIRAAIEAFISMGKIIPRNVKNAVVLQKYTLMSVMTTPFSKAGFSPKFVLAVIGKTNAKKTTCALNFCKLFNRKNDMGVDISFNSTEAALYDIMEKHSDAAVIIDDLVPAESSAEERSMQRKLEILERAYGDRSPRQRCTTFAKNKDAKRFVPVKGCALITGETFGGKKSSQTRVIRLNFEPDDVDTETLAWYQQRMGIVPTVVEDFIKFVSENFGLVMKIVENETVFWRKELENIIETPRFRDAFGSFAATAKIFGMYLKEKKFFANEFIDQLVAEEIEQILAVIKENDDNLRDSDPFTVLVESIRYALMKKQLYSANDVGFCDFDHITDYLIVTDDYYLLNADKLYECAKTYFSYTGRHFSYKSRRDIVNALVQAGAILEKLEGQKKRHTHKASVGGKTVNRRFLHIFKDKFEIIKDYIENV